MQNLARRCCERHIGFLDALGQVVPAFPVWLNRKQTTILDYTQKFLLPRWQDAMEKQRRDCPAGEEGAPFPNSLRPTTFWKELVLFLKYWNIAVPWIEGGFEASFSSWSRGENLGGFSLWSIGIALEGALLNPYLDIPPLIAGDDIDGWLKSVKREARRVLQEVAELGDPPERKARKLMLDEDLEILASYQVGGITQAILATRYGVSQGRISVLLHQTADELGLTLSRPREILPESESAE